jgi:hypothetical protein
VARQAAGPIGDGKGGIAVCSSLLDDRLDRVGEAAQGALRQHIVAAHHHIPEVEHAGPPLAGLPGPVQPRLAARLNDDVFPTTSSRPLGRALDPEATATRIAFGQGSDGPAGGPRRSPPR